MCTILLNLIKYYRERGNTRLDGGVESNKPVIDLKYMDPNDLRAHVSFLESELQQERKIAEMMSSQSI